MRYAVLLALTVILLATSYTYQSTLNAGIAFRAFGHCIGYETQGVPGFFVDVDCR